MVLINNERGSINYFSVLYNFVSDLNSPESDGVSMGTFFAAVSVVVIAMACASILIWKCLVSVFIAISFPGKLTNSKFRKKLPGAHIF